MKCLFINHYYSLNFLPILTVLLRKAPKTTKLFEFILDILSEPRYSSVISWEGTNGQFAIKRPDQVASLWGERNGRINMTYQKFSRALRYYYHKKVVTKIRGRNCVYKFNFPELEKQYGFHSSVLFPATTEPSGNRNSCEIPATCANHIQNPTAEYHFPATREFVDYDNHEIPASFHCLQHPNTANAIVAGTLYSVRSPVVVRMIPHESQSQLHSPSCPNPRYYCYWTCLNLPQRFFICEKCKRVWRAKPSQQSSTGLQNIFFFPARMARSAVSVILACEERKSYTPVVRFAVLTWRIIWRQTVIIIIKSLQ